jgi:hypothetical protein
VFVSVPLTATSSRNSDSWKAVKNQARLKCDVFLEQHAEWAPMQWDRQPANLVCSKQFYEQLAYFLMHTYVSRCKTVATESGPVKLPEILAPDTVVNYLFIILTQAKEKFKVTGQLTSKAFLMCLDSQRIHRRRSIVARP